MTVAFRVFILFCAVAALCAAQQAPPADLDAVRQENNLERRSELALDYSTASVDRARTAYNDGKLDEFQSALGRAQDGAEFSYKSLQDTGKAARRHPKYWKRAEKKLRLIMKKLDNLEQEVSVDDRTAVAGYRKQISDVHDRVLIDIMTKKK